MDRRSLPGRPVTDRLAQTESVIEHLDIKAMQELLVKVEPILPLVTVCTCALIAALQQGKKLFLHGRDMDAVFLAIAKLYPQYVESGALIYEVTSRSWVENDETTYDSYHRRLALHDRNIRRVHVDTGFSGSIPHKLRRGGFNVEAIWLIGTGEAAKHRMMPVPHERRAYWRRPIDTDTTWGLAGESDREARYHLAAKTEDLPHELSEREPGQTWEQYLDSQEGEPRFWIWVQLLKAEVQKEWANFSYLYKDTVNGWIKPSDNYVDTTQSFNKWAQMDPRLADAYEQPNTEWRASSGPAWNGLTHWLRRDLNLEITDAMIDGLVVQRSNGELIKSKIFPTSLNSGWKKIYRIRLMRRFYNGSQTEKQIGRKMTPGEFKAWQGKRDRFLEELQRQLGLKYSEVKLEKGWIYFLAD